MVCNCTHSPHGDEYALLVHCERRSYYNTRLCLFYDDFHAAINAIAPPGGAVAAEEVAFRKEAAAQELVSRGRKQLETALNAVTVSTQEREAVLAKYGAEWKLKPVDFLVGVSTGLYVPTPGRENKNWAKHADEALDKAKARDGKNGIVVYFEYAGGVVLAADDGSSKCMKPTVYKFYKAKYNVQY